MRRYGGDRRAPPAPRNNIRKRHSRQGAATHWGGGGGRRGGVGSACGGKVGGARSHEHAVHPVLFLLPQRGGREARGHLAFSGPVFESGAEQIVAKKRPDGGKWDGGVVGRVYPDGRRRRAVCEKLDGSLQEENIDLKPHEIARQAERKRGLPPSSCLSPLSRYGVFMVPQTMAAFSSKRGAAGSTRAAVAARRTSSDNSSSSFGLVCQKELGLGRDNGMPHLSCCRPRAPLRAIPLHDPFMLAAVLFHFAPALYGCDAVAQND